MEAGEDAALVGPLRTSHVRTWTPLILAFSVVLALIASGLATYAVMRPQGPPLCLVAPLTCNDQAAFDADVARSDFETVLCIVPHPDDLEYVLLSPSLLLFLLAALGSWSSLLHPMRLIVCVARCKQV